jgi:hypothetical protein
MALAGGALFGVGCAHEYQATAYKQPEKVQLNTPEFDRAYREVAEGRVNAAQSGDYLIEKDAQGKVEVLNTAKSYASEVAKDSWITTKVTSDFATDRYTRGLHVTTDNGVVTLDGTVDNPDMARHAVSRALEIKGVRAVKSNLMYPMGPSGSQTFIPQQAPPQP